MSGWGEKAIFAALAAGLHVLAFAAVPQGGARSSGAGGEHLVTLQGATPQLSAMVSDWRTPPEVAPAPQVTAVAPQPQDAPGIEVPRIEPAVPPLPPVERPESPRAPVDPLPAPQALPRPAPPLADAPLPPTVPRRDEARPTAQTAPAPSAVSRSAAMTKPGAPVPPPAPDLSEARETAARPSPTKPEARPQRQTRPKSAAAPAQKSAGSGGAEQAGTSGRADTATLSAGQRRSLMNAWGARIRTRIERRKRHPRGVSGGGRVVLNLQVGRNGDLKSVAVRQSSGSADLDAAAVRAVRRAGRFPAAPEGLRDPVYRFSLPIRFNG